MEDFSKTPAARTIARIFAKGFAQSLYGIFGKNDTVWSDETKKSVRELAKQLLRGEKVKRSDILLVDRFAAFFGECRLPEIYYNWLAGEIFNDIPVCGHLDWSSCKTEGCDK